MVRTLIAIVSLALGVITSWGLAALGVREHLDVSGDAAPTWVHDFDSFNHGWLATDLSVTSSKDLGDYLDRMPYAQWRVDAEKVLGWSAGIAGFRAMGFPLRCFTLHTFWPSNGFPRDTQWGTRFTRVPFTEGFFDLPIRPIWPALAVNTAFFAGVWWVAFLGVGRVARPLIRRRRVRRTLCARCAFPRLGLPATADCPECGWPAPKHIPCDSEPPAAL